MPVVPPLPANPIKVMPCFFKTEARSLALNSPAVVPCIFKGTEHPRCPTNEKLHLTEQQFFRVGKAAPRENFIKVAVNISAKIIRV